MIYFSNFDSSVALSDALIAVKEIQTGTTTGSAINYTSSTITGKTPKAALIFGTQQIPSSDPDGTVTAQLHVSLTETGGSVGWRHNTLSATGTSTTTVRRTFNTSTTAQVVIRAFNGTNSSPISGTASCISGGVSINYGTAAQNTRLHFLAFAGTDVSSAAGTILIPSSSTNSIATGFVTSAAIFVGTCYGSSTVIDNNQAWTFGIATWDGTTLTQRCVMTAENNGAADGNPFQAILTGRCAGQVNPNDGSLTYHVTAGNFSSSGFDITTAASSGGDYISYLALKFGTRRTKLVDYTSPTSTGNQSVTGAGFTPQFALVVLTNLDATDPTFPISTADLSLCIASIGDEQWSIANYIDSGAATTSTRSFHKNQAICMPDSTTATSGLQATLTAFTSDGMTLNYTSVMGTGKKGFILFVE